MNMPKKKAMQFVKKYSLKANTLTRETLRDVLKRQGFLIFRHNKFGRSPDKVDAVLRSLRLVEYAEGKDSFVYASSTDKVVFVCSQIDEDAELYLLLHEMGHIACNHPVQHGVLAYNDVLCEQEANAFAFYVVQYINCRKIIRFASAACALLLAVGVGFALHAPSPTSSLTAATPGAATPAPVQTLPPVKTFAPISTITPLPEIDFSSDAFSADAKKTNETLVYVARTGSVYHKKNCSYIRGKDDLREVTIASAEEEWGLPPCSRCRPDK